MTREKILNLLPLYLTGFLLSYGILGTTSYYREFNITILNYYDVSDILLSSFYWLQLIYDDFLLILSLVQIFLFVLIIYFVFLHKITSQDKTLKFEKICLKIEVYLNKHKIQISIFQIFMILTKIVGLFTFGYYLKYINYLLNNKHIIPTIEFVSCHIIVLHFVSLSLIITFTKNKFNLKIFSLLGALFLLVCFFTVKISMIHYSRYLKTNCIEETLVVLGYKTKQYKLGKDIIYLGGTTRFIFLFDKKNQESEVLSLQDIEFIKVSKTKSISDTVKLKKE